MSIQFVKRAWMEVDLDAIAYNYRLLQERNGGAAMLGIVKADAYGMGAVAVSRKLESLGVRYLAVADLDEALQLRKAGIKAPILILGYVPAVYTEELIENDITASVPTAEDAKMYAAEAQRLGKTLRVHLKLDSGMGRLGFRISSRERAHSLAEIREILPLSGLDWEGVFMHFAVSDMEGAENAAFTRNQFDSFTESVREIEAMLGRPFALKHCSNSGASTRFPGFALDMIRPGIALYGFDSFCPEVELKHCIRFKAALGPIKEYEEGSSVSYGRLFTNKRRARIGIVPAGYADGLQRGLTGQLSVMTPYGPAPVVGRICMDMCMLDVTELPEIRTGDEVELYGDYNSVRSIADRVGTITHVISCAISDRVPRVYTEGGKVVSVRTLRGL